jgi:hypothetical protein
MFFIVTVFGAEVVPTFWFPKASDGGLKLSATVVPVPERDTTCGEAGPSSVKESRADAAMAVCGVKVTVTEQDELGATVEPQVFALMAK